MREFIFDIDGTLANSDHRLHFIKPPPGGKKLWSAFFAEAKNDQVHHHVWLMNRFIAAQKVRMELSISIVTARPNNLRADTEAWLKKHGIDYDALYMRPINEHKPDYEVKRDIYNNYFKANKENIICVFEDRLEVAKMWREEGIPVFLCGDDWLYGKE